MRGRYVVMVKPPDDHPGAVRIFGPWRSIEQAGIFCDKIRNAIDLDVTDETTGFAYVAELEQPAIRKMKAWATKGER